jgi:hypothetical protein
MQDPVGNISHKTLAAQKCVVGAKGLDSIPFGEPLTLSPP